MCVVGAIGVSLFLLLIGPVVSVRAQLAPIEVQKLRPNLFLRNSSGLGALALFLYLYFL